MIDSAILLVVTESKMQTNFSLPDVLQQFCIAVRNYTQSLAEKNLLQTVQAGQPNCGWYAQSGR
jgi:hypothetical protein